MKQNPLKPMRDLFKVFSDLTRLRIIDAISQNPKCVKDLVESLDLEQSNISHQLRILKDNQVVSYKREGKRVYYTLKDSHVKLIYEMAKAHVCECD